MKLRKWSGVIVGIGIDLCSIERIEQIRQRRAGVLHSVFTDAERNYPGSHHRRDEFLAGAFAAKEALVKALDSPSALSWKDMSVDHFDSGRPFFRLSGTVANRVKELDITRIHLSISHDAGIAAAYVICERES